MDPPSAGNGASEATLPPPPDLQIPDTSKFPHIPGYQILEILGHGGMGIVYKARQLGLNRLVALKMLLSGDFAHTDELSRFQREAVAVANLHHPHIVQIYEVGEFQGRPYFSLEYVDGGSLANKVNGTPLPPQPAAQLVEMLARAMHAAHEQRIIHRDLKPANILLARSEGSQAIVLTSGPEDTGSYEPKIADFGLAKRLGGESAHTQSGAIVGTPSYMAPEQAGGKLKEIGPAADVYALGAILYELLTGRPPFKAANPLDTVLQVIGTEVLSPSRLQPKVPRDLATICMKCLQKEPRKRYASALALADDLRRFVAGESIQARPMSSLERTIKWIKRRPAVAGLLAALTAVVLGALIGTTALWLRAEEQRQDADRSKAEALTQSERAEHARADAVAKANEADQERHKARQRLVQQYVANGERLMDAGDELGALAWFAESLKQQGFPQQEAVCRTQLSGIMRQCPKLLGTWLGRVPNDYKQSITPDGRRILLMAEGTAQLWDITTGQQALPPMKHGGGVDTALLSPDGRWLLTLSPAQGFETHEAQLWSTATGKPALPPLKHPNYLHAAAFSPDSRLVATGTDKEVWIWECATGKLAVPPLKNAFATDLVFSPDGRRLLTSFLSDNSRKRDARLWDVATGKRIGPRLADKRNRYSLNVKFSPTGQYVLVWGEQTARVWDAATGQPVTPLLEHLDDVDGHLAISQAAFDPSGTRLVTAGPKMVQIWNARTGKPSREAIHTEDTISFAEFSPDGSRLVTVHDSERCVRVWDAFTGRVLSPRLVHAGTIGLATFSPDGHYVVTACNDRSVRVWDVLRGVLAIPALPHLDVVSWVGFSPDGRRLLTTAGDQTSLWDMVRPDRTTPPIALGVQDELSAAVFTPDQKPLVTVGSQEAKLWNATTGQQIPGGFPQEGIAAALLSPDGRRLLTSTEISQDVSRPETEEGFEKKKVEVRLWNTATHQCLAVLWRVEDGLLPSAEFSPDGTQVALVVVAWPDAQSDEITSVVRLFDAATGKPIQITLVENEAEREEWWFLAKFSPDKRRLLTVGNAGLVRLWDVHTGKPLCPALKYPGSSTRAATAAFSSDGRLFAVGSYNTAQIYDAAKGRPACPLLRQATAQVEQLAFSPDGKLLVTAGGDWSGKVGVTCLWNAATGRLVFPPLRHSGMVRRVRFSPDGRRVLTFAERAGWKADRTEQEVYVWDVATGQFLPPTLTSPSNILDANFSPDGMRITTISADGKLRSSDLRPDDRPVEALQLLAQVYAARNLDEVGTLTALEASELHAHWQTARQKYPDLFTTSERDGTIWRRREADECERSKDHPAAIFHLTHLLEAGPDDGELRLRRGRCLVAWSLEDREHGDESKFTEKWDRAAADLNAVWERGGAQLLTSWPCNEIAWPMVSRAGADAARYRTALRFAERGSGATPQDGNLLNTLGVAQYRVGQYDKAVETLTRADQINKGTIGDVAFLAMAHQRLGHKDQAQATYRRMQELVKKAGSLDKDSRAWVREVEELLAGKGTK
jgi:WD40 repeat protein/serine/threonine protein kinase/tetratricopeptide (TPR) repeat protein